MHYIDTILWDLRQVSHSIKSNKKKKKEENVDYITESWNRNRTINKETNDSNSDITSIIELKGNIISIFCVMQYIPSQNKPQILNR